MLNIIEPKDHEISQSCIGSFLGLLKVYQSFSLVPKEKQNSTFLIGEDNQRGVYGGAVLYQQKVSELYKGIGKVVSNFQPERQEVWVARVGLYLENEDASRSLEILDLRDSFYENLLKGFIEFGEKQNLDVLCLTLCSSDFYRTRRYGYWPYILEITASDASDGLFHGILSLNSQEIGE